MSELAQATHVPAGSRARRGIGASLVVGLATGERRALNDGVKGPEGIRKDARSASDDAPLTRSCAVLGSKSDRRPERRDNRYRRAARLSAGLGRGTQLQAAEDVSGTGDDSLGCLVDQRGDAPRPTGDVGEAVIAGVGTQRGSSGRIYILNCGPCLQGTS
jgi:hypothetical protein